MTKWKQMTIFDFMAPDRKEVEPGALVESHGRELTHEDLLGVIGQMVVMDKSTESHEWFNAGVLECYFWFEREKVWIANVYDGGRQRNIFRFYGSNSGQDRLYAMEGK